MRKIVAAALFSTVLLANSTQAQTTATIPVEVSIDNVKSQKGNILISVFKNEHSFNKEKPDYEKVYSKKDIKKGKFKTTLHLAPGTYGIAILDDENADKKMNYNLLGMPKEGYGFSNFYHSGYSKPKFSNFSFKLEKGKKILKAIKLRYF
jgi:uncharacterized protein (DUF2141 family)